MYISFLNLYETVNWTKRDKWGLESLNDFPRADISNMLDDIAGQ